MKKPTVHLICNAHLDPVWQWRWEEGCAETLSTFQNTVQLLHEHDQLIFNHNEALLYRWVQKFDPGLFKEIQNLVKAGRWFISGGWFLQPDVNMPGIESLIRHILEGRRFFKEYFGVQSRVAYNFDSFGHSGGLPQILTKAGYKMYIHMRPQQSEFDLPSDLYRWRGVDGSEIIGLRIAVGFYYTEYDNIRQRLKEGVELALKLNRDVPVFWGIGNHGGGATREDLKRIDDFIKNETRVKIIHSTTDHLYESLKDFAHSAPLIEGDLQRVFTGCYTSLSRLKRQANKSLQELLQTETLCALTWWNFGHDYPQNELTQIWQDHLFNDFHDILPGSCIQPAEQDALDLYGKVNESLKRLRLDAAVIFNRGSIKNAYLPVTIINSNPALTTVPVEVEFMISHRPKWSGMWHIQLFDRQGNAVSCQEEQPEALLPLNGWRRKVSFMANLPEAGATNYYMEAVEGEWSSQSCSPAIHYSIDKKTGLIRELNYESGQNFLSAPLHQPLVVEDKGDSWGRDCWNYRKIIGTFEAEPQSIQTIESGPIRTINQTVMTYNHSKIIMNTIGYADFPVIEYRLQIHWNEQQKRLKLSIPTIFNTDYLVCEIPGGIIERPADGEEHVHGRWFMLNEKIRGKDIALGVVNSGQHGIDYKNGEVRISVLRSAAYCHELGFRFKRYPAPKFMDQGAHEVRLLVTIGKSEKVKTMLPALADWLAGPPLVYAHLPVGSMTKINSENILKFSQPEFKNLLSLKPDNIRLITFKRSEDKAALILRLQETTGKSSNARIIISFPPTKINLTFKPLEIKTVRLEKSGLWLEVDLIDEE